MCLTAVAVGLGLFQAANQMDQQRRARHAIEDQRNEARNAETRATQNANAAVAARRRALRENSLVTSEGGAAGVTSGGRSTLGGI